MMTREEVEILEYLIGAIIQKHISNKNIFDARYRGENTLSYEIEEDKRKTQVEGLKNKLIKKLNTNKG